MLPILRTSLLIGAGISTLIVTTQQIPIDTMIQQRAAASATLAVYAVHMETMMYPHSQQPHHASQQRINSRPLETLNVVRARWWCVALRWSQNLLKKVKNSNNNINNSHNSCFRLTSQLIILVFIRRVIEALVIVIVVEGLDQTKRV